MADTPVETGIGSRERVAFDLYQSVMGYLPQKQGIDRATQLLELYSACLEVTLRQGVDLSRVK